MSGAEVLIPITIFGGGFAMIFGIVYLKTRENLAMVEKNMNPRQQVNRPAPFKSLKLGLLLMGAGIGLLLAYILDLNMRTAAHQEHPPLYFALIAIGGGLGLIASYAMERSYLQKKNEF
ncbi:MAG: DUF6249 domain-containing protein [Flavisolibacter sp.]